MDCHALGGVFLMNYTRDPLEDARRVVLRDPGFAAWILVTSLWVPLPRAVRWCRVVREARQALHSRAAARSLASLMARLAPAA